MTRTGTDGRTFLRMAREFPVRTGVFTVALPAFALLQLLNGFVHGGRLAYVGVFALAVVAYSAVLTRYHVAAYRRYRLARR